jgi:hypothetical protein
MFSVEAKETEEHRTWSIVNLLLRYRVFRIQCIIQNVFTNLTPCDSNRGDGIVTRLRNGGPGVRTPAKSRGFVSSQNHPDRPSLLPIPCVPRQKAAVENVDHPRPCSTQVPNEHNTSAPSTLPYGLDSNNFPFLFLVTITERTQTNYYATQTFISLVSEGLMIQ